MNQTLLLLLFKAKDFNQLSASTLNNVANELSMKQPQCHWQSFALQGPLSWAMDRWKLTQNVKVFGAENQKYSLSTARAITHKDTIKPLRTVCPNTPLQHAHTLHQHALSRVGCDAQVLSFILSCGRSMEGQEKAGEQGQAVALNELLGAFPSAQGWVPRTWLPGSLLGEIPFKTIICQLSYSPCFCVYIFKVMMSWCLSAPVLLWFLSPLSHEPLSLHVLPSPPHTHTTCYSGVLLSIQMSVVVNSPGSRSRL